MIDLTDIVPARALDLVLKIDELKVALNEVFMSGNIDAPYPIDTCIHIIFVVDAGITTILYT